jgi:U3 small nucleolar RNA-associated protein 19
MPPSAAAIVRKRNQDPTVEAIRTCEKAVLASIENANGLVEILKYMEASKPTFALAACHSLRRIFQHFIEKGDLTLGDGASKKSKKDAAAAKADPLAQFRKWLRQQYLSFLEKALACLGVDDMELQVPVLRTLMHFVTKESRMKGEGVKFGSETFVRVIKQLICASENNLQLLVVMHVEFVGTYDDVRYYTLTCLQNILTLRFKESQEVADGQGAKGVKGGAKGGAKGAKGAKGDGASAKKPPLISTVPIDVLIRNSLYLLCKVEMPKRQSQICGFLVDSEDTRTEPEAEGTVFEFDSEDDEPAAADDKDNMFPEAKKKKRSRAEIEEAEAEEEANKKPVSLRSLRAHRKAFGTCWVALLKFTLTEKIYKDVLARLPEQVIPHMLNPLLLADFLTDSFNIGGEVSLLSLNGLFLLIHQHELDYPQFYEKLYTLIVPEVFTNVHREKFFELTHLFMSSPLLPGYLVAAFIKRFARMALTAPPAGALFIIPFAFNLIIRHRECLPLISRPVNDPTKRKTSSEVEDVFVLDEDDPTKCRALESSLWEIKSLRNHYCADVATLAAIFEQRIDERRTQEYKIEEYTDFTYDGMFAELLRTKCLSGQTLRKQGALENHVTPLAYKPAAKLFGDDQFTGMLVVD